MNGTATINRPLTLLSLTLQFMLELAALAALGDWGYSTGNSSATRVGLAVAAPFMAAALWGLVKRRQVSAAGAPPREVDINRLDDNRLTAKEPTSEDHRGAQRPCVL